MLDLLSPRTAAETTAFGELAIAELTPAIQIQFPVNINPVILEDRSNNGTLSVENNMAKVSTGAGTNQSGGLQTIESIQYHPGQGTLNRFTSIFTTGVTGATQTIGIGDSSDGFFFGYNGADFGILRRRGGAPEIRTLTVTTGSTTAENITITLDGDAKTDVAVTVGSSASETANEIADADYSNLGKGWKAHADGDATVRFESFDSSSRTGTYSLSSATTAVGTFAQTLSGVAATEVWVLQTAWNLDNADGTGVLPVIDFTKGNVFEIRYQWLGFGPAYFYIENPSTGEYINVHTIRYANTATVPSIANPNLPLCISAENTSNTSDIVMFCGSMAAFVEGKALNTHFHRGADTDYSGIGTTETPIMTLHNKEIFQSKKNHTLIKLILLVMNAEGTKPSTLRIRKEADLIAANYNDIETAVSVIEFDVAATSFTNGSKQIAFGMGKSDTTGPVDLEDKSYVLRPGERFTITGQATNGTIEGTVSVNWEELN